MAKEMVSECLRDTKNCDETRPHFGIRAQLVGDCSAERGVQELGKP
jgi:hypothetical protein